MFFRLTYSTTIIKSTISFLSVLVCICFSQFVWEGTKLSPTGKSYRSVTFGKEKFVAVGWSGIISTSPDGYIWTKKSSGVTVDLLSVTYGDSMFVATGEYGTILMSPDGETWTPESSGTSSELRSVTYGGNQFMAVGRQGTVITSVDGLKWSISNKKPDSDLNSVIYSSNRFMAVGASGCIISSVDGGATWTSVDRYSTTYQELSTVTYGNNRFLVVSDLNEALISGDGIRWTIDKIRIPNSLYCATFGNGQFVVAGVVAAVMSSPDGVTWTRRTKDASYLLSTLYGVIYAKERFVAVGDTILISKKDAMPVISNDFVNRMNKRVKMYIKNGNATISLPSIITDKSQKMFVQISTPSGKLLYSLPVSREQSILHFRATGLTAGTYIINLMCQDKRFTSSCILVQ